MIGVLSGVRPNAGVVAPSARPEGLPEELTVLPPDVAPWFTIIVPARNEEGSVATLPAMLAGDIGDIPAEVLFVDDSSDDTPEVIRGIARSWGPAVRLLHRPFGARHSGLGGAVVAGLKQARGPWAVVMDADLQRAKLAARLVAICQARQLDLVAGTRYHKGGQAAGLAGGDRRAVSGVATSMTKSMFPRHLARLSDPMSGFFAAPPAALNVARPNPIGFKILLERAVRRPRLQIAEVPFVFGTRLAGDSKASVREGFRNLRQLQQLHLLVLGSQVPKSTVAANGTTRLRRLLTFGTVGLTGVGVNTAPLWLLSEHVMHHHHHHHYRIAAVLASEASHDLELRPHPEAGLPRPQAGNGRRSRGALLPAQRSRPASAAALAGAAGRGVLGQPVGRQHRDAGPAVPGQLGRRRLGDLRHECGRERAPLKQPMRIAVDLTGLQRVPAPFESAAAASNGARPLVPSAPRSSASVSATSRYLPYRHAIDGVITVGSQVPLKELEYFRVQRLGNDLDLSFRIGQVGRGAFRTRALMTQFVSPPSVGCQDQFGRLGATFHVDIGDKVQVVCSPTLARSPHVLYTSVIEALPFLAVSRGVILLPSACLELDGSGLLLSARTETGKIARATFLSGDLTIIHLGENATCFPEPLTISHHTLRAVQAGYLTPAEWRRPKLHRLLHSKEGRNFGLVLAGLNIPIMGVNSFTQRIVLPLKYNVDRLVECSVIRSVRAENLFVIERGAPALAVVPFLEAIQTLAENTDDAHGLPPFRQLAPSIIIGSDDYDELRRKERAIVTSAMANIRVRRLASDTLSWADDIAGLLGDQRLNATGTTVDLNDAARAASA